MPVRGAQFPVVNENHFQTQEGATYVHRSTWQGLDVFHHYTPDGNGHPGGFGAVTLSRPSPAGHGKGYTLGGISYELEHVPRATTLRAQPLTHTSYIDVDEEHRNHGWAQHMQSVLAAGHPGAPNIASNELTSEGAAWRGHMARTGRDPGGGERIGMAYSASGEPLEHRVFRPAKGQPKDALVSEPDLFFVDHNDAKVAKGRRR